MFGDSFFKKVEKKTNVSKDTILSLANKLQDGNMKVTELLFKMLILFGGLKQLGVIIG